MFFSELRKADRCFIGSQLVLSAKFFRQITQPKKYQKFKKLTNFRIRYSVGKLKNESQDKKFLD